MNEFIEKLKIRLFKNSFPTHIRSAVWFDKAIEIIDNAAEEYNNGWIPCSERLPEESGEYLTYVEYAGDKFIAIDECFCGGILKEWNCTPNYRIIAWQPLPGPYKPTAQPDSISEAWKQQTMSRFERVE